MSDRRLWTAQEDDIISHLVSLYGLKKWTVIAEEMKKNYPLLARSSKQIRERFSVTQNRWYNHLDPNINKKPWTIQEQELLFEAHKKHGSKWKEIAKLLKSRTDNSAKNHFYSTLRRSLRRINKYLGFKNSTNQMRLLKPSILSKLIETADIDEESRALVNGIFRFAKVKPCKNKKQMEGQLNQDGKKMYKQAIEKILDFNNKYDESREFMKKKKKKIFPHPQEKETQVQTIEQNSYEKDNENERTDINFTPNTISFCEDHYSIEVFEKQSWEASAEQNRGMLPDPEKPESEDDILGVENQYVVEQFMIEDHKQPEYFELCFSYN